MRSGAASYSRSADPVAVACRVRMYAHPSPRTATTTGAVLRTAILDDHPGVRPEALVERGGDLLPRFACMAAGHCTAQAEAIAELDAILTQAIAHRRANILEELGMSERGLTRDTIPRGETRAAVAPAAGGTAPPGNGGATPSPRIATATCFLP